MAKPAKFGLIVRAPKWARMPPLVSDFKLTVNEEPGISTGTLGYAVVRLREWKDGDRVKLSFRLVARMLLGHFGDTGQAALKWGPFVLAYDASMNPGLPPIGTLGLLSDHPPFTLEPGPELKFRARVVGRKVDEPKSAVLVPFADAGASGGAYRVWLRAPGIEPREEPFAPGRRRGEPLPAGQPERLDHRRRPEQLRGHLRRLEVARGLVCRDPRRAGPHRPRRLTPTARISTTAAGSTPAAENLASRSSGSGGAIGRQSGSCRPIPRRRRPAPPTSTAGSRSSSDSNARSRPSPCGSSACLLAATTRIRHSPRAESCRRTPIEQSSRLQEAGP